MGNKALVTFIMPAYNVEKYIRKAVDSILAQTCVDWKLIIVDDHSTDSTLAIAKEYAGRDARITVMQTREQSGGCYAPRRVGIEVADTEFVSPLDADDWIGPDYLKNLLHMQSEFNADIVYPTMNRVNSSGTRPLMSKEMCGKAKKGSEFVRYALDGWQINCNGGLLRRELYLFTYKKYPQLTGIYFQDELQTRQLLMAADRVVFSEDPYYYRINDDSITRKVSPMIFAGLNNSKELRRYVREWFGEGSEEEQLTESGLFHHMVNAIRVLRDKKMDAETRRVGNSILRECYESINWRLAKPRVSKLYYYAMRCGLRKASMSFAVIDFAKRLLRGSNP